MIPKCRFTKEKLVQKTYAQIVRKNFTPKMNSNDHSPFLGQTQQPVVWQESQMQAEIQESFLDFLKSQKEILRRLEQLEINNNQFQNQNKKW